MALHYHRAEAAVEEIVLFDDLRSSQRKLGEVLCCVCMCVCAHARSSSPVHCVDCRFFACPGILPILLVVRHCRMLAVALSAILLGVEDTAVVAASAVDLSRVLWLGVR
jgi:hypothetical protein